MHQSKSFTLLGQRATVERVLVDKDKKVDSKENKHNEKVKLTKKKQKQQPLEEFVYTNKNISHKLIPQQEKGTQKVSTGPDIIRNDIFLIKTKVNRIRIQNHEFKEIIDGKELQKIRQNLHKLNVSKQDVEILTQVENYCIHKLINGSVSLRIIQRNHFYMKPDSFKQKFEKQLKPIESSFNYQIQAPSPDQIFQPISSQIQKITNLMTLNSKEESDENPRKPKRSKELSKLSKHSLFRMMLSSFEQKDNNQKNKKPFNLYEQNYKLHYSRKLQGKQKQHEKQEEQDPNELGHEEEKHVKKRQVFQARPNLANLFGNDDSLIFSGTEDSVFEIKFEEPELHDTVEYLNGVSSSESQKLPGLNVFWARFKLKNFSDIPFTEHQVTIKLDHKLQNRENQEKRIHQDEKIKFLVDLSLFFVPGNTNGWGVLKIDEIAVNWKDFLIQSNSQKKFMKLKIEFPDVIQRNKRLLKSEQSQVQTKIQCLDHGQNPIWTEDLSIRINPQRNKFHIMLIEMEENRYDVKSIIAQRTIHLLEEGFLFDRVQSTRHILLKSFRRNTLEPPKVADLMINFTFEIAINDKITHEKSVSDRRNAFINHFGTL